MGCDIHATIEIDEFDNGTWYGVARDVKIDRSYYLFTVLANVRSETTNGRLEEVTKPIAEPRGLPKNPSWDFEEELKEWDFDAHSISWVTFKELKEYQPKEDWSYKNWRFYKYMEFEAQSVGEDRVRLAFFFDN